MKTLPGPNTLGGRILNVLKNRGVMTTAEVVNSLKAYDPHKGSVAAQLSKFAKDLIVERPSEGLYSYYVPAEEKPAPRRTKAVVPPVSKPEPVIDTPIELKPVEADRSKIDGIRAKHQAGIPYINAVPQIIMLAVERVLVQGPVISFRDQYKAAELEFLNAHGMMKLLVPNAVDLIPMFDELVHVSWNNMVNMMMLPMAEAPKPIDLAAVDKDVLIKELSSRLGTTPVAAVPTVPVTPAAQTKAQKTMTIVLYGIIGNWFNHIISDPEIAAKMKDGSLKLIHEDYDKKMNNAHGDYYVANIKTIGRAAMKAIELMYADGWQANSISSFKRAIINALKKHNS